jgi:DNA-binding transcriptional ArsR family regulator
MSMSARVGEVLLETGNQDHEILREDISQTDSDPIPTDSYQLPAGDGPDGALDQLGTWLTAEGWTLLEKSLAGGCEGYTDHQHRVIVTDTGLDPAARLTVLLHEAAHLVVHGELTPGEYQAHRGLGERAVTTRWLTNHRYCGSVVVNQSVAPGGGMPDQLSRLFAALADPTRRDIVARLAASDATVGQLAAPYEISKQAVSKHLRVLEEAGLVTRSGDARRKPVQLEAEVFDLMTKWIVRYQREAGARYRRLDAVLATMNDTESSQEGTAS